MMACTVLVHFLKACTEGLDQFQFFYRLVLVFGGIDPTDDGNRFWEMFLDECILGSEID
ncbi:uncharacterized protein METZ01_LOCUS244617 [marine metagenome]|uniref:Uncharacterized protein n=1 Tax=marine metagenome TaxID=408172 RepID=A0A382HYQ6_9ZZZZ